MKMFLLLFVCVFFNVCILNAQDVCLKMFPTTEGSVLIDKVYDRNKNVTNTIKFEIVDHYSNLAGTHTGIKYTVIDKNDILIEEGVLKARCENYNFYLDLENSTQSDEFMNMIAANPEFIANFLYFPIILDKNNPNSTAPEMENIDFHIKRKDDSVFARVKIYNREYQNLEEVIVPAGIFNADKIRFDLEITIYGDTKKYKINEWYASGAGIVRLQSYDDLYNLISYAELTVLDNKEK